MIGHADARHTLVLELLHLALVILVKDAVGPARNPLLVAGVVGLRAFVELVGGRELDLALPELGDEFVSPDGFTDLGR